MTVKEWLKNGRNLNFEIQALREARNRALNAAVGGAVDYGAERVQTSSGNGTERLFVEYSRYSAELERRIAELEDYRAEMLRLINKVSNTTYRTLLIEYYINCKSWEDVAESLERDLSWVLKREKGIRDRAIKAVSYVYKENRGS